MIANNLFSAFSSVVNIVSARGAAIVQVRVCKKFSIIHLVYCLKNVVTVTKMVGVVIVIIGGFVRLGQGHVESFKTGFDRLEFLDPIGPASIGLIAFNGLWNYDGWNQLNFVAEEIKVGTYNSNNEFTFDVSNLYSGYVCPLTRYYL